VRVWVLLLATLAPVAGRAQGVMTPAKPEAPLDSTAAYYRTMLLGLRDALNDVSTSANELRRDLQTAGDVTVLAKADRLSRACASARAPLHAAIPAVARAQRNGRLVPASDSFTVVIRALDAGLEQQCVRGLGPTGSGARADTLRAWGRYRTAEMAHLIAVYHSSAAHFAAVMGFKLPAPTS